VAAAAIGYVLFDLDDTLVDHSAAATTALGHAIARWSNDSSGHDHDELRALWRALEQEQYDAYLRGECTHAEQRVRRLERFLPALGVTGGDDAFLTAQFRHYLDAYVAAWSAFADVLPALDALAAVGIGTAVLTNGDPRQQRLKLERTGLLERFDHVLTPTEVGAPKPDAKAFVGACTLLGLEPARTAYVGDNLPVDAVGASAAGLRGIWLARAGTSGTPGQAPPPTVTTITSLTGLVAALG
jgi:putative hydrolase of the HAD superfamily